MKQHLLTSGIVGGIVGFALALGGVFIKTPTYFTGEIPTMEDGLYTAYYVHPAFDTRTGEPIYWVVGGKGRYAGLSETTAKTYYIEPHETKLFSISRDRLPDMSSMTLNPARDDHRIRIDVVMGHGKVVPR